MTTNQPRSGKGESPVPPWVSGAFLPPPPRDSSRPPDQAGDRGVYCRPMELGVCQSNGPAPDTLKSTADARAAHSGRTHRPAQRSARGILRSAHAARAPSGADGVE